MAVYSEATAHLNLADEPDRQRGLCHVVDRLRVLVRADLAHLLTMRHVDDCELLQVMAVLRAMVTRVKPGT